MTAAEDDRPEVKGCGWCGAPMPWWRSRNYCDCLCAGLAIADARLTDDQRARQAAASARADAILYRIHGGRYAHLPEREVFRRLAQLLRARGHDVSALTDR